MSQITVILGGQFGSEGKGAFAQYLAEKERPDLAFRTGGPNAGHSILPGGHPPAIALRHIPAAVACPQTRWLVIPPAGLINPKVLLEEIAACEGAGFSVRDRLAIDPLATIIGQEEEEQEKHAGLRAACGSTLEGVGAAQAAKVMRTAAVARDCLELEPYLQPTLGLVQAYAGRDKIHVETTQGVGLSLHYGLYPYATSRDLSAGQALSDCQIGLRGHEIRTVAVFRTYPIRVAGNSGPLTGELTWTELAEQTRGYVKPEQTTVTKLTRRVGRWDPEAVRRACRILRPDACVLTFYDYDVPPNFNRCIGESIGELIGTLAEAPQQREVQLAHFLADRWLFGDLDKYREPLLSCGTDLHWVSAGFGLIAPTPANVAGGGISLKR